MNAFYSQHGEDFLLDKIFNGKTTGYYVEVGCLDGVEYSNSFHFENKGWKGACIEAHNDFIESLRHNRPLADVIHCAVGETNKDSVTFYANKAGSLSTLNKEEEDRWKKNYRNDFHGFEEQQVRMRTLTAIFDELHVVSIDFVSLDIEGYEVNALQGLDLTRYRPKVFVIEYKDEQHKKGIERLLLPHGYYFLSKIGCNIFYSIEQSDKEILRADHGKVELIRIDPDRRQIRHVVDLSRPSVLMRLRHNLHRGVVGKLRRFLSND